jgi:pyruvate carboxylase
VGQEHDVRLDRGVRLIVALEAVGEVDQVSAGQTVATIEAMKMEASITAAIAGAVQRVAVGGVQQVEGGDLILVLG